MAITRQYMMSIHQDNPNFESETIDMVYLFNGCFHLIKTSDNKYCDMVGYRNKLALNVLIAKEYLGITNNDFIKIFNSIMDDNDWVAFNEQWRLIDRYLNDYTNSPYQHIDTSLILKSVYPFPLAYQEIVVNPEGLI